MWPFKPKSIVDADTEAWLTDNFCWLLKQFGWRAGTRLVLPKKGFFKSSGGTGHSFAVDLFEQVKAHCCMSSWKVDLVADYNPIADPGHIAATRVASERHAAGTFSRSWTSAQISYVPNLLRRPEHFIATMAHELGHYLLSTAAGNPPCEKDEEEPLTDLTAVFMGFGVFMANSSFEWGNMGRLGYLTERNLIFALALFLRAESLVSNRDSADSAMACLKPHLASNLRKALRYLAPDGSVVTQIRGALGLHEKQDRGKVVPFVPKVPKVVAKAAAMPAEGDRESGSPTSRRFIKIVSRPRGDAPEWVRDQWIGLRLPLAVGEAAQSSGLDPGSRIRAGASVASGGIGSEEGWSAVWKLSGFWVDVEEAVSVLEQEGRVEAVQWWRNNITGRSGVWIFDADCAELVS